jgi:hypothetical protein
MRCPGGRAVRGAWVDTVGAVESGWEGPCLPDRGPSAGPVIARGVHTYHPARRAEPHRGGHPLRTVCAGCHGGAYHATRRGGCARLRAWLLGWFRGHRDAPSPHRWLRCPVANSRSPRCTPHRVPLGLTRWTWVLAEPVHVAVLAQILAHRGVDGHRVGSVVGSAPRMAGSNSAASTRGSVGARCQLPEGCRQSPAVSARMASASALHAAASALRVAGQLQRPQVGYPRPGDRVGRHQLRTA